MGDKITAKAVVTHELGKRTFEDVNVRQPGKGELLIDMVASGICHTDIVEVGSKYPLVQGHEGSGYVRAVGPEVTVAKAGDAVLLSFASCGACHFCGSSHPAFCASFAALNFAALEEDYSLVSDSSKTVQGSFFGQSSFASTALVKERSVVNVTTLVKDREELKLMAPLGCGLQTGSGTILRIAKATKEDSLAVLGLGGVGLSAVMAGKILGCKQIIAIDIVESRLQLAKELGATELVNPKTVGEGKLVEHVQSLVDGLGPTVTLDTTAVLPLIAEATQFTRPMGKMVQVGAAPLDQMMQVHVVSHVVFGKQLMGGIEGDSVPDQSVPEMIQWWRDGKFPFEKLIKFYDADKVEEAVGDMKAGQTIKPVLVW